MILAKDFIETAEGLVFAVVESGLEQDRVLCFLRYIHVDGRSQKLNTEQANDYLEKNHPCYIYYSVDKDAHLHGVKIDQVVRHHKPRNRLKEIINKRDKDDVEKDLVNLCRLYEQHGIMLDDIGVTGSILISAQRQGSDIDLVFYSRQVFNQARQITRELIGLGLCDELNQRDWEISYDRRQCDLSYAEYLWHEKRKFNKAVINQRKFDLNFVPEDFEDTAAECFKKLNPITLKVKVTDDSLAFDYPAEFRIDHPQIKAIVSFTATYTGQAKAGEWVEVSGVLEESSRFIQRIVVGTSREANGEYIRVIND